MVSPVRFFYRPVGWLGVPAPGSPQPISPRLHLRRQLVYEEQSAGETEAQYNVDGAAPIARVSSDNKGTITYYYNAIGVPLDPEKMSGATLAAKAAIDEAWRQAREAAQVR